MQNSKPKYNLKEKLDIAESISTVLMFLMAVWGSIVAYEAGFWHKLMHIINHYHTEIIKIEQHTNLPDILEKTDTHAQHTDTHAQSKDK